MDVSFEKEKLIWKSDFSTATLYVSRDLGMRQAVGCRTKRCLAGYWMVARLVERLERFRCEADFGEVSKTLGFLEESATCAP